MPLFKNDHLKCAPKNYKEYKLTEMKKEIKGNNIPFCGVVADMNICKK